MLKIAIQISLFILPWSIRRRFLIAFLKFNIHPSARIGYSIILADRLNMHAQSRIGNLTTCKNINLLDLGESSSIGSNIHINGFNTRSSVFPNVSNRRCELVVGRHSALTHRHLIDCNGGIYIGDFTTIAGYNTQLLSHSIDLYRSTQDAAPIRIGSYCFIGTRCILLPGSVLPDYSILGAGAVLNKAFEDCYCLYGGVPAMKLKIWTVKRSCSLVRVENI